MNLLYTPVWLLLAIEAYQFILSFLPIKVRLQDFDTHEEMLDSPHYWSMMFDVVCSLGWVLCLVSILAVPELRLCGAAISIYYGIRIIFKSFMNKPVWLANLLDLVSVFGLSYFTLVM